MVFASSYARILIYSKKGYDFLCSITDFVDLTISQSIFFKKLHAAVPCIATVWQCVAFNSVRSTEKYLHYCIIVIFQSGTLLLDFSNRAFAEPRPSLLISLVDDVHLMFPFSKYYKCTDVFFFLRERRGMKKNKNAGLKIFAKLLLRSYCLPLR